MIIFFHFGFYVLLCASQNTSMFFFPTLEKNNIHAGAVMKKWKNRHRNCEIHFIIILSVQDFDGLLYWDLLFYCRFLLLEREKTLKLCRNFDWEEQSETDNSNNQVRNMLEASQTLASSLQFLLKVKQNLPDFCWRKEYRILNNCYFICLKAY